MMMMMMQEQARPQTSQNFSFPNRGQASNPRIAIPYEGEFVQEAPQYSFNTIGPHSATNQYPTQRQYMQAMLA